MKRWPILLSLTFLMFTVSMVIGQDGSWTTFNTSNSGLAHNDVRAIAVDGDFIWFGTYGDGLSRYQKSTDTWHTFNQTNSDIISNFIQTIAVAGEYLWIGADAGLSRFHPATNQWTNLGSITCISSILSQLNDVWITTVETGVYRYEKNTGVWTNYTTSNSELISNIVTTAGINGDKIWFGTNGGVSCYDPNSNSWQSYTTSNSGLENNNIISLAFDGDDIWFGHEPSTSYNVITTQPEPGSGQSNFNNDCPQKWLLTETKIHPASGFYPATSVFRQQDNQWDYYEYSRIDTLNNDKYCYAAYTITASEELVWVAASKIGIYSYHKATGIWTNFNGTNSGLAGDWAWTIAIDGNSVWIGTYGHGVSRYRPVASLWQCYRKSNGLIDESPENIAVFGNEAWIGTHRGLSKLQISSGRFQNYDVTNSNIGSMLIWEIAVDSQNVWFGPVLTRYWKNSDTWEIIDTTTSRLGNSRVYSMSKNNSELWFGAEDGKIVIHDKQNNLWTLYDSTITRFKKPIAAIDVDESDVWFAVTGEGIGYYSKNDQQWAKYDTSNSGLTNINVTSVGIDGEYIWFGTFNGGICRYEKSTNNWTTFTDSNTGQSPFINNIWCLAIDRDFIWFGSNSRGAFRYEKSTGIWENFNHLNSPLPARRVYDIECDGRYAWFAVFDTDYLVTPAKRTGGICRFGDVVAPDLQHTPVLKEQPSETPVLILASIKDEVQVKSANLHYRKTEMPEFNIEAFEPRSGDLWIGQIPAIDVTPGIMEYYITASDGRNITTHPFTSPQNSPHRFKIYDSVRPQGSVAILSPSGYVIDFSKITVSLSVNGTGSEPEITSMYLVQYADYATETVVDSSQISLIILQDELTDNIYSLTGTFDIGQLRTEILAIKLAVMATDKGHDGKGNPHFTYILSNSLPKFQATGTSLAQILEPDSMAVVTGVITIKGTAYDDNIKQYSLSYQDSLLHKNVIQSSITGVKNSVLGTWNTEGLPETKYTLVLEVETVEGAKSFAAIPVILDNTQPLATIEKPENNAVTGGQLVIIGSATDDHFKEYRLEYGKGINPVKWNAIGAWQSQPVVSDTLGEWNTLGLNGYYSIRLEVVDAAGLSTEVISGLTLDNSASMVVINNPIQDQVVCGTVKIEGSVVDENFLKYSVEYKSVNDHDNWYVIHQDTTPVNSGLLALWNTTNLNGHFFVRLKAEDKSHHISLDSLQVIVDNTPPVAAISSPRQLDQVSVSVPIYGIAFDENFREYVLEWGEGSAAETWTRLTSQRLTAPVQDDLLFDWNASGKLGYYGLRLTVMDQCGQQSRDSVVIEIIKPIQSFQGGWIYSSDGIVQLYVPPNSVSKDVHITINPVPFAVRQTGAPQFVLDKQYDIAPTQLKLDKPGILRFNLSLASLSEQQDKKTLAIAKFSKADTTYYSIGGTYSSTEQTLSSAIDVLDCFTLIKATEGGDRQFIENVESQPRVFSPRGGGYDNRTSISFSLGKAAPVTIKVYNLAGRLVRTIAENELMNPGTNVVYWDGKDSADAFCLNDLYAVVIEAEGKSETKTVMVLNK